MAAGNFGPHILRMRSAQRERPLSTRKIYNAVAQTGVAGFDPTAKRDRNLLNRELSDLAGMSPEFHSKPTLAAPGPGGPWPWHSQVAGVAPGRGAWRGGVGRTDGRGHAVATGRFTARGL